MNNGIKIVSLELENVKRVRAVHLDPVSTGLTVIGGGNCQGKTSILDGICYALGGEKYRPTNLQRDDGAADARLEVMLSNGLKVERRGKNAALHVTDPAGEKAGQRLLDSFVEELALNLPKFLAMNGKSKAEVLLRILGIGDQLTALDNEERLVYDERTTQGRVADQKEKYAAEMPEYHDVPDELLSAAGLVQASQAVMQRNAAKMASRQRIGQCKNEAERARLSMKGQLEEVHRLEAQLDEAKKRLEELSAGAIHAAAIVKGATERPIGEDESTAEIETHIAEMETVNAKIRQNLDKRKALEDAEQARDMYKMLSGRVEEVRARRSALLDSADMPLAGLSVENSSLTYHAKAWDCMSSAEQIRSGVAIVRALKPECGFVLLDGLERMDREQLTELNTWLTGEGLQAIATRVSHGDECSIIIEDGLVLGGQEPEAPAAPAAAAPAGEQDW